MVGTTRRKPLPKTTKTKSTKKKTTPEERRKIHQERLKELRKPNIVPEPKKKGLKKNQRKA